MLLGQDISHHNGNVDVNVGDFTIIKATEGQSYTDPKFKEYVKQLHNDQLVGCYHFIRADVKGNDAWREADNFVRRVMEAGLMYKSLLIVDYEAKSVGHEEYLLRFLQGVQIMTDVKPIIYCSCSVARKLKKCKAQGYEFWIAHYDIKHLKDTEAKTNLMWQFTDSPWDFDLFMDTESGWVRRTKKVP